MCHVFSLAVRVMKGIVKPINRSAKARDTMNLWKRCRRNLVDLRITVTSTAFDRMMMNAVTNLKMVFGDDSNTENSSGSQSDIVDSFLGNFHAPPIITNSFQVSGKVHNSNLIVMKVFREASFRQNG